MSERRGNPLLLALIVSNLRVGGPATEPAGHLFASLSQIALIGNRDIAAAAFFVERLLSRLALPPLLLSPASFGDSSHALLVRRLDKNQMVAEPIPTRLEEHGCIENDDLGAHATQPIKFFLNAYRDSGVSDPLQCTESVGSDFTRFEYHFGKSGAGLSLRMLCGPTRFPWPPSGMSMTRSYS